MAGKKMNSLQEARKIWPDKTDEWLYHRLDQELKQKIEEIQRLLRELSRIEKEK